MSMWWVHRISKETVMADLKESLQSWYSLDEGEENYRISKDTMKCPRLEPGTADF